MANNQCPGQNRRFWGHRDIFDSECQHCGAPLEFWKDDIRRACPSCGQSVLNPKIDLACARWCKSAEQCLEGLTLEDQVIAVVKDVFAADPHRFDHALHVLDYAKRILESEQADARVVVTAALLHDAGSPAAEPAAARAAPGSQSPAAVEILRRLGVEEETCDRVGAIVAQLHAPATAEPVEFDVVYDADVLENGVVSGLPDLTPDLEQRINAAFRTAGGRRLAKSVILQAAAPKAARPS
ncbi:HD domain-containing protein [bacterium]|nr:HD domain-containing protein [bacterium]